MPQSKRMSSRSKLPVLERYTKTKKPAVVSNDYAFQNVISGVGASEVLVEFADYLGRKDLKFITDLDDTRKTRQVNVPSDFSGIAFDGAHWKGYENGTVEYNSYPAEMQAPKTNNYCQSYATYLWAKHGDISPFVKGEFAKNVQKMSKMWLDFFDKNKKYPEFMSYIKTQFETEVVDIATGEKFYPNLAEAIKTLRLLASDFTLAAEFASSKQ